MDYLPAGRQVGKRNRSNTIPCHHGIRNAYKTMNWQNIFGLTKHKLKPFSAWQIELTTRCPLKCRMCIREGLKDWQSGDMSFDNFKRLIPYFKNVERVVLEGWGESLLHKNLIEIIRLVKAEGPEVGFVTSGKGLNKDYISELINASVDFIGFSLSGCSSRTHDSIRIRSGFQSLLEDIKTFNKIKESKKLKKPALHVVYLMLKDNIFELPALIGIAKGIGIKDVVLINLIHVTNDWQERQRVFSCLRFQKGAKVEYEKILREVEAKAKEMEIKLKRASLSPTEVYVCEENPLKNLYISTDGEVAPCVYLYQPVFSPIRRIFCGGEHQVEKLSFGNIFREPFQDIWNKKEYVEFRNRFTLRKKRSEGLSLFLRDIKGLGRDEEEPLPEPPVQCISCYKILGV